MKKIIFLLVILSFNAHATNFIDTLGAECGRILFQLYEYDYPLNYDNIKPRNSQFWALHKCLKIYKENGGNIDELNEKYDLAQSINFLSHINCVKKEDEKEQEECHKTANSYLREHLTYKIEDLKEIHSQLKK